MKAIKLESGETVVRFGSGEDTIDIPLEKYKSLVKPDIVSLVKQQGAGDTAKLQEQIDNLKIKCKQAEQSNPANEPMDSLTAANPNELTYLEHMKKEVDEANNSFPPGDGGGFIISSDHVGVNDTLSGSKFVFDELVLDMATALKSALRTPNPLDGEVFSMSMALIVKRKQGPDE